MAAADPPRRPEQPPSAGEAAEERFGPLRLRRIVKDDGRVLIVYRRRATRNAAFK
jgi:hypothetical protein